MLVKDILKVTKGKLVTGNEDIICTDFSRDSRNIKKGDTYFGIKGAKFDGNDFWKEALENGAMCIIIDDIKFQENEIENFKDRAIIKVDDTLEALYKVAEYKRSLYNIPVVAITGSVGKTSTKDITANVVSKKFNTLKTYGNSNNNIGLPFTILNLRNHEALVLEMGMNHFGEIELLSKIAKPEICVITNIGTSHIGNLGSRENILKAKLEILKGSDNPIIIINNDDDLLHRWYEENKDKFNIKTYGINNRSDINAFNIKLYEENSSFECDIENVRTKINVPVAGEHFILNSMCAILVGRTLGIPKDKIVEGIQEFELTKKRMDIKELDNGVKIINDAYNASFESMRASLKNLSKYKNNRKIAVLGDMFELGNFSKELHEKVGEEVFKNKIDVLICSGENAKYFARQAKKCGMRDENIYYLKNNEQVINKIKEIYKSGDVILIKASNGMKFYDLVESL